MTMPDERTQALISARELLLELSLSRGRVNMRALRERATLVLRHYPDEGMISLIARETSWLSWSKHR